MKNRRIKWPLIILSLILFNCNSNAQDSNKKSYKISKTDSEWKQQLNNIEYYVLRKEGTESAFSSPLNKNYKIGVYICKACNTPLFNSDHKFNSGTGWPSFDRPIKNNIAYKTDNKLVHTGQEVHCATCGGHLGHVFNDGPIKTTGKRYCINGVSLKFIPKQ